ncbi:ParA family protein [Corynebacterium sanguinis]|nr:ParA family protein [Corynebacterium sanguinis]
MGKTTSAVLLCAAAHARGIDVTLIDSDAQGTATAWAQAAEEAGDAFPWPIVTAATPANLARALDGHDGLVIVDTPPGGYEVIETAIVAGDLIFIPTSASPLERHPEGGDLQPTDAGRRRGRRCTARPPPGCVAAVAAGSPRRYAHPRQWDRGNRIGNYR